MKSKMQYVVARLQNLKSILTVIVVLFSLVLSSCLPTEKETTTVSSSTGGSNIVADFLGIATAQTISANKVKVTWIPSANTEVAAYNIYDASVFFSPVLLKTVLAPANEVTLTGLSTQKAYMLMVRAAIPKTNGTQTSGSTSFTEDTNSKVLGAIPYAGVLSAIVASSTSAMIPFNSASDADSVLIYCKTNLNPSYSLSKTVSNVSLTQTTITGLSAGVEYTCRAALKVGSVEDNNQTTTVFTPIGQATDLVFSTQPTSSSAGINLPGQPVVTIKDGNGNTVSAGPDATAVITLSVSASSPTTGTIRGTASVTAVGGVATFTGINFQEAGVKIIQASKADTSAQLYGSGILLKDSSSFTISAGAVSATKSLIAISPDVPPNPALVANGNNSYTVNITLKDQYDNPISGIRPSFATSIVGDTLSQPTVNTNASGLTSGSISTTVADTTAPFRTLRISSPAGLSTVTTLAPFVPGTPSKLAFTVQPTNSPSGPTGLASVKVAVQDAQGNTVISGAGSTATITLSISSNLNGAALTGTYPIDAIAGVATFNDLGIDKTQTGYKLLASSGSYVPAYSNSFNVTAGTPKKIILSGPALVTSGQCSAAFSIQLQDNGNNPSNAIQNTPLVLSGLGTAQLFSSPACSGSPLTSTLTFTAGTNTRQIYFKDLKAEALTFTVTDSSAVLTTGTLPIKSTPNKLSMLAEAASPAPGGTPLSVKAGQCSTVIKLVPAGENNVAGPLFSATTLSIIGASSDVKFYTDAGCTSQIMNLTNVIFPITTSAPYVMNLYIKDSKAEVLSLSILDVSGGLTTTSGLQTVTVNPSKIFFTGPTSVVAGICSTAYAISLRDELGNSIPSSVNTSLTIDGLGSSLDGKFYTSPSCAGGGSSSTLTLPANSSSMSVYFKDINAETLAVSISDPATVLATSPVINIGVSPSALRIVAPTPANSKTSVCAGPFDVQTLDGGGIVTNAITPITVNLSGFGTGGAFYNNSFCTGAAITTVSFIAGDNTKSFYFKSHVPSASRTFVAADAASVLTAGQVNFASIAAPAWIGTDGTMTDSGNNLLGFRAVPSPTAARVDGPYSVYNMAFDSTKQFLYVADFSGHRLLKYDYTNTAYIGWIGGFSSTGGIGITGSKLATPSPAQCVSTVNSAATPGWCTGGQSYANANTTSGQMYGPIAVTDDGTYIYVNQYYSQAINRYDAVTGAFAGWIGRVGTTPTAAAAGGPGTCTTVTAGNQTPGWCMGGANQSSNNQGNGNVQNPRANTNDGTYLYVSTQGMVNRYLLSNGSFQGWIGMVATNPTGGAANCTTTGNDARTPGWCTGGTSKNVDPRSGVKGGMNHPTSLNIIGTTLYVVEGGFGGVVATYNVNTGAFIAILPSLTFNWVTPYQMTNVGSTLYFADTNRLLRTDNTGLVTGWIGKVSNSASMSGNVGCSTLVPNANTPGWCIGGTSKNGADENSFYEMTSVLYDGNGYLLTGQGYNGGSAPSIKKWDITTGAYQGTLTFGGTSTPQWNNSTTTFAQSQGFDDGGYNNPAGIYNDGSYIYVADRMNSRIKKIDMNTGAVKGWIGGITTSPTGGENVGSCTSAIPMSASPGWCTGSMPNIQNLWNSMINQVVDGIMYQPSGITADATYLFVTDYALHRIQKFDKATGAYIGWIGRIATSPTDGDPGCNGALVGNFTPGWCKGGMSTNGTADGNLWNPSGITYAAGNVYVVDLQHRVLSFNATTGAYNGWIGRIGGSNPTSGCTFGTNGAYNVSLTGWCKGGTSAQSVTGDRGGGFYMWGTDRNGLTTDGTNLYVANFYNTRIDKISLGGVFLGAVRARQDIYTDAWSTNPATIASWAVGCSYPMRIWMNGTHIYGVNYAPCSNNQANTSVYKLDLATGNMVGWQGAIYPGGSPTSGDANCAGATLTTPGWCRGGTPTSGFYLGQSAYAHSITGDANFIYFTDEGGNRVTRLPK